jgi:hypothetical protein
MKKTLLIGAFLVVAVFVILRSLTPRLQVTREVEEAPLRMPTSTTAVFSNSVSKFENQTAGHRTELRRWKKCLQEENCVVPETDPRSGGLYIF